VLNIGPSIPGEPFSTLRGRRVPQVRGANEYLRYEKIVSIEGSLFTIGVSDFASTLKCARQVSETGGNVEWQKSNIILPPCRTPLRKKLDIHEGDKERGMNIAEIPRGQITIQRGGRTAKRRAIDSAMSQKVTATVLGVGLCSRSQWCHVMDVIREAGVTWSKPTELL